MGQRPLIGRSGCLRNGVPTSGAAPASRLEVTPCNQPIGAGSIILSSWNARSAADIPGFSLSRGALEMSPGGGFVVAGVGLETAVQDTDEAVAELAQGGLVADAALAQGVVVGAGAG
jgi:hypothetical protein